MLADKNTVHLIIPQEPPMVMVDTLEYQDDRYTVTTFFIEEDNLFIEEGVFSLEGMVENMAQTAALRTGWKGKENAGGGSGYKPPVGVIGAVKDFKVYRCPGVKTMITTKIEVTAEVFNATMVSGRIMQDEEVLAEGELKIFLQE